MKSYDQYVTKDDVQTLHEKTLYVLKNVGVSIEHEGARELLRARGARVDGEIVYFDEKMVNEAVSQNKKTFEVYSSKKPLPLETGVCWWGLPAAIFISTTARKSARCRMQTL